mmetsp:Transcript_9287/g.13811  ORF Transcript_9287/g.13811 Transcript_9287/m.13811 type:complete len:258 (-) Transcript_9287:282-1055(-)
MAYETNFEKFLMLIITGITNFASLPGLYILYHKGMFLHFHIGMFTMATSFLYHSLEAVQWEQLYLNQGGWHKLDNIGSILCFILLMVYWMDNLQKKKGNIYHSKNTCTTDIHLIMGGTALTLTMQAKHPWLIENTVVPILVFLVLLLIKLAVVGTSRLNKRFFFKGMLFMGFGVMCFVRGLDDQTDYLRFWHGCWHCGVGLSSFYLWQSIDKDRELKGFKVAKYKKQKRYKFLPVLKNLVTFRFFTDVPEKPEINKV